MNIKSFLIIILSFQILSIVYSGYTDTQEFKAARKIYQKLNQPRYFQLKAKTKLNILWKETKRSDFSFGSFDKAHADVFFTQDNSLPFNNIGDSLPENRDKLVHTNGIVGKVKFRTLPNVYTGILNEGSDIALLRFSAARDYDTKDKSPKAAFNNFVPSFAIKFLIDGHDSADILTLNDRMGSETWNFFEETQTTSFKFSKTDDKLIKRLENISKVTIWVNSVGLNRTASFHTDGRTVNKPKYPLRLDFKATNAVISLFSKHFTEDFKSIISRIPIGTVIYEAFAIEEPGCPGKKIGDIISDSEFVTSLFGDLHLFFRHGFVEDDVNTSSKLFDRALFKDGQVNFGTEHSLNKKCPFFSSK